MVVQVEPERIVRNNDRSLFSRIHIPLLYRRRRNVNAISLATTAHGKVDIKRPETLVHVALGHDVEGGRVIKNMVVERKLAAKIANVSDERFQTKIKAARCLTCRRSRIPCP